MPPDFSPIKGPEGNIEYLMHLQKLPEGSISQYSDMDMEAVVEKAHADLDKGFDMNCFYIITNSVKDKRNCW